METILFFLLLAVTAYAWRPRRAQRPAVPSLPRLPGPHTRRPPEPFLASLAAFFVQCGLSMKSTARAVQTTVMLELDRQGRRRSPVAIMSRDDDDADDDEIPAMEPISLSTAYHVPRTEPVPADAGQDQPDYKLKLARFEALAELTAKGLTPAEQLAIQEGQPAAIKKAQILKVTRGTLAAAMGGTRAERLAQIAAALEVGDG